MTETDSHNIIPGGDIAQHLVWSFADHFSSLHSFTASILNTSYSNSNDPGVDILVNTSQYIQQSLFPDLAAVQV